MNSVGFLGSNFISKYLRLFYTIGIIDKPFHYRSGLKGSFTVCYKKKGHVNLASSKIGNFNHLMSYAVRRDNWACWSDSSIEVSHRTQLPLSNKCRAFYCCLFTDGRSCGALFSKSIQCQLKGTVGPGIVA